MPAAARLYACLCCAALLSHAPRAAAGAVMTANAISRYGSGNTTYGESKVTGVALPSNGSTGLQEAGNTHLRVLAQGASSLATNSFGGGSAWIGASVIDAPNGNGGTIWNLTGGSLTRLEDRITIASDSLVDGTPVEVHFTLFGASATSVDHSDPTSHMNDNFAFLNSSISGSVWVATNSGNRYDLRAEDHHLIRDTTGSVPAKNTGLLNPNSPRHDFAMNAHVGEELVVILDIQTSASGKLSPITVNLSPIELENAAGVALSAVGLSIGASPALSGVDLQSELFGGAFPAASAATAANAAAALPFTGVAAPLAGDYNNDGVVDAADYSVWRDNAGAPAGTLPNDADGGPIGEAQYQTWRANYGAAVPAPAQPASPAPEPACLAMFLAAALGVGCCRFDLGGLRYGEQGPG